MIIIQYLLQKKVMLILKIDWYYIDVSQGGERESIWQPHEVVSARWLLARNVMVTTSSRVGRRLSAIDGIPLLCVPARLASVSVHACAYCRPLFTSNVCGPAGPSTGSENWTKKDGKQCDCLLIHLYSWHDVCTCRENPATDSTWIEIVLE